jgi:hypothetical protein
MQIAQVTAATVREQRSLTRRPIIFVRSSPRVLRGPRLGKRISGQLVEADGMKASAMADMRSGFTLASAGVFEGVG